MKKCFDKIKKEQHLLMVISGPSGVGKDAVIDVLMDMEPDIFHVTTATTRTRRPEEIDGKDYIFTSKKNFQTMINNNELLEWALVYGNYYGIPKNEVRMALERHKTVIIKVDVQGAKTIKKIVPKAIFVFVMPSSKEELAERLIGRGNIIEKDLRERLGKADSEMDCMPMFDYFVVNKTDYIDEAAANIRSILVAERSRIKTRKIGL
jgi:guanylate kinase